LTLEGFVCFENNPLDVSKGIPNRCKIFVGSSNFYT